MIEDLLRHEYRRLFGRVVEGVPFEIVNLRLFARADRGERSFDFDPVGVASGRAVKSRRLAYFDEAKSFVDTIVYDRAHLRPGLELSGPAIIEEKDTTIIVPPGARLAVDEHRNVIVTLANVATN